MRRRGEDSILGPFLFFLVFIVALNIWGYFSQP